MSQRAWLLLPLLIFIGFVAAAAWRLSAPPDSSIRSRMERVSSVMCTSVRIEWGARVRGPVVPGQGVRRWASSQLITSARTRSFSGSLCGSWNSPS